MSGRERYERTHPGSTVPSGERGLLARAALKVIGGYQRGVSPGLGKNCRYLPTCSAYMYEAIELHGLGKGGWLGLKRIGRCHPLREGGYDPVPRPSDRADETPTPDTAASRREDH